MTAPRSSPFSFVAIAVSMALSLLLGLFSSARAAPDARRPAVSENPLGAPAASQRPPFARADDGGPSRVIYPQQTHALRFDHSRHVKGLGMTCTTCHDEALRSKKSADSLLPKATRCDACHGSDHRKTVVTAPPGERLAACNLCHLDHRQGATVVAGVDVPPPNLRFDHAVHVGRGVTCARCHGAVSEVGLATVDQLPRMRACLECHRDPRPSGTVPGVASGACPTCHLTERAGLLKTTFREGTLLPPSWLHDSAHDADWIERHKRVAGDDSQFCANCHTPSDCNDCHDGRTRPRTVHPNDFLSMHPAAARRNDPACTSCHSQQSFCLSCHQRSGVTMTGPVGARSGAGRFHPPAAIWTNGARSARHHAWEAQRNLNACVSCHVERDCTICHATASVGGRGSGLSAGSGISPRTNPHPAGFRGRCARALRQNARPCLVCHDPADPTLGECR
jgi:hypothetical protein